MSESKLQEVTKELTTNGLVMHESFPVTFYESVHTSIVKFYGKHAFYEHYSGAWNALSYRYQAVILYGDEFVNTLKTHGTSPNPIQRFKQERLLFDFYSSIFSAYEATYYALYSIGHFISPEHFPIASAKDQQKISFGSTKKSYLEAFPKDHIINIFESITNDPQYYKMREIRNVLSHRTAPGRKIYLGLDSTYTPVTEWKLNDAPLDERLITDCIDSLSQHVNTILSETDSFVERNI